jgi:hypothetical protein
MMERGNIAGAIRVLEYSRSTFSKYQQYSDRIENIVMGRKPDEKK